MESVASNLKLKLGRKGDPRMNRAIVAKLKEPNLSLHKALIIGGFNYPEPDDNNKSSKYSLQDSEGALLGQRKNQLSRRLREAKNQIELNIKRAENVGSLTAAVVKEAFCQSLLDDGSLPATKIHDKGMNDAISSPAAVSVGTSDISLMLRSIHQNNVAMSMHSSNDSYASIFSDKLKDCDSFSVPSIPIPTDTFSILNYSNNLNQDSKNECKYELERSAKNQTPTTSLFTNNEKSDNDSKPSDVTERKHSLSSSSSNRRLHSDDLKRRGDFNDDDSVGTILSFKSKNERNNVKLKKALDYFVSDFDSYLQGLMIKAGYSRSEITEEDFYTFFASTITSSIKRFQSLTVGSTASCYFVSSIPLKKRKLENDSDNYPQFVFDEKQTGVQSQELHQNQSLRENTHRVEPRGGSVDSYLSNKKLATTVISDLTFDNDTGKNSVRSQLINEDE